jgi:flagellar hook-length control protein FliK
MPNALSVPIAPTANDLAAALLAGRSNRPAPAPASDLPNADPDAEPVPVAVDGANGAARAAQDQPWTNAAASEQLDRVDRPVPPSPQSAGSPADEDNPGPFDAPKNIPLPPSAANSSGSSSTGDSTPSNTPGREFAPGFPTPPAGQPEVPPSVAEPVENVEVRGNAGTLSTAAANEVEGAGPGSEPQSLENQIVRALRMQWRGGIGEARLTLHPKYLGAVAISLRVEQGGMTAIMHVEDPQVRAWIQGNEALLKHGLASHGLTLERLVVSEEETRRDRHGERDGEARRDHPRHSRRWLSENAPRFEITG